MCEAQTKTQETIAQRRQRGNASAKDRFNEMTDFTITGIIRMAFGCAKQFRMVLSRR
jgi:hypothetical protein